MPRAQALRTHDLRPAASLLLALLLILRCATAWAGAPATAAAGVSLQAGPAAAHALLASSAKRGVAKCEAITDGPSPPSSNQFQIRWPTSSAVAQTCGAAAVFTGAPAPPPPARGPPPRRA